MIGRPLTKYVFISVGVGAVSIRMPPLEPGGGWEGEGCVGGEGGGLLGCGGL